MAALYRCEASIQKNYYPMGKTSFASENSGCSFDGVVQESSMNMMDAAKEAASITSCEKTVRQYRKEFYTQKGKFKEGKQGKYKGHCLLNDENLRFEAAMWVREMLTPKAKPI